MNQEITLDYASAIHLHDRNPVNSKGAPFQTEKFHGFICFDNYVHPQGPPYAQSSFPKNNKHISYIARLAIVNWSDFIVVLPQ